MYRAMWAGTQQRTHATGSSACQSWGTCFAGWQRQNHAGVMRAAQGKLGMGRQAQAEGQAGGTDPLPPRRPFSGRASSLSSGPGAPALRLDSWQLWRSCSGAAALLLQLLDALHLLPGPQVDGGAAGGGGGRKGGGGAQQQAVRPLVSWSKRRAVCVTRHAQGCRPLPRPQVGGGAARGTNTA